MRSRPSQAADEGTRAEIDETVQMLTSNLEKITEHSAPTATPPQALSNGCFCLAPTRLIGQGQRPVWGKPGWLMAIDRPAASSPTADVCDKERLLEIAAETANDAVA